MYASVCERERLINGTGHYHHEVYCCEDMGMGRSMDVDVEMA